MEAQASSGSRPKSIEERDAVVIRFAGDSGDGMQLTGTEFPRASALYGNDLATFPDYPAEIRAPAGTLFGVSSFQLQFGSQRVYTPGDQLDALVVMNPAAFKVHLADLKPGGILIVNPSAFDKRNLDKAGYAANPLDDPTLGEKYRLHQVDMEGLTKKALEDMPLNAKEKDRCKNFFALGLVSWVYTRPLDPTLDAIKKRFAKRPEFVEANIRALKAGHAFGETAEMFAEHYGVEAAEMPPGTYRSMTGNRALAWGLLAAAGVFVLLDTSGEPLRRGLAARPDLIKPNSDELTGLTGFSEPARAARDARRRGARAVAASLGSTGQPRRSMRPTTTH